MTGALPGHYARAFADAVFGDNAGISPGDAVVQFRSAEELISGSEELRIALRTPAIKRDKKIAILSKLAEELGLQRVVRNFLLVVITHGRIHQLKAIRDEFERAVDERLGWIRADIASARELSAPQREEIERVLGVKLGKFVRADYKVDPDLLAGVRARVASKEFDATLRGKLEGMRQSLQIEN